MTAALNAVDDGSTQKRTETDTAGLLEKKTRVRDGDNPHNIYLTFVTMQVGREIAWQFLGKLVSSHQYVYDIRDESSKVQTTSFLPFFLSFIQVAKNWPCSDTC